MNDVHSRVIVSGLSISVRMIWWHPPVNKLEFSGRVPGN